MVVPYCIAINIMLPLYILRKKEELLVLKYLYVTAYFIFLTYICRVMITQLMLMICITGVSPVRMSGWNIDMSIAREKSLFWHGLWILCGKAETGQVARIMRFTRNNYHYKI